MQQGVDIVIEDKGTIDIVVNMQEKVVHTDDLSPDGEISFDQVVGLASEGGGLPSGPYIEYEVFYENALGRPLEGRLYPDKGVKIQDGTVFNVTYTDKS